MIIGEGGGKKKHKKAAQRKIQKGTSDSDYDPSLFPDPKSKRGPYFIGGRDYKLPTKKAKKMPESRPNAKDWHWYNAWEYQKKYKGV